MRLSFERTVFRYDPYPIGVAKSVLDEESYAALIESFPSDVILRRHPFVNKTGGYKKFALNERADPDGFYAYIKGHPVWKAFHASIKQQKFINFIFTLLKAGGIRVAPARRWTSRFEFSGMPADGGYIVPHTDVDSKAVTLIFSMVKPGEWDPAWGGGTDILKPLDPTAPLKSYAAPLDQFEKVDTCEFVPNQCVLFVKNDVSWHSVGPMTGPADKMRRTITLNIERE